MSENRDDTKAQHIERRTNLERRSMRGAFRLAARDAALRRRGGRRKEDLDAGFYTDRHDAPLLLIAMSVLLFSVIDSILTLQLIARGAEELNPLLAMLIEIDVKLFAWTKTVITAMALVLLVSHANHKVFGVMRIRKVLVICLFLYSVLVTYQAVLIAVAPPPVDVLLTG